PEDPGIRYGKVGAHVGGVGDHHRCGLHIHQLEAIAGGNVPYPDKTVGGAKNILGIDLKIQVVSEHIKVKDAVAAPRIGQGHAVASLLVSGKGVATARSGPTAIHLVVGTVRARGGTTALHQFFPNNGLGIGNAQDDLLAVVRPAQEQFGQRGSVIGTGHDFPLYIIGGIQISVPAVEKVEDRVGLGGPEPAHLDDRLI